MARSTNALLHYVARFDDGEVVNEKCRNTLGGFINMMKRFEKLTGEQVRGVCKATADGRYVAGGTLVEGWGLLPNGAEWVEGGRRFTLTELVKVAPGMFAEVTA